MGAYINPDIDKYDWVAQNSIMEFKHKDVPLAEFWYRSMYNDKTTLCVHIDNGPFSAIGVLFNYQEFMAFHQDGTNRPRTFFVIPRELALKEVPNLELFEEEPSGR